MNGKSTPRRDVLKLIGATSVGAAAYSGSAVAEGNAKGRSISGSPSYDVKLKNGGAKALVVTLHVLKHGKKVVTQQSPILASPGDSVEKDLSLEKGSYTFKVRAVFKESGVTEAEQSIMVPEGGIPDYLSVNIVVRGDSATIATAY